MLNNNIHTRKPTHSYARDILALTHTHSCTCKGQDSRWLLSLVPVAAHRIMRKSNLFVLAAVSVAAAASQLSQLISNCLPTTTTVAMRVGQQQQHC